MIDEFGNWGSEEESARLDNVYIQLSEHPDAKIQFLISRGEQESLGSPHRFYAKVEAYLNYRGADLRRIIPTFCKAKPERAIQIWLVTSEIVKECEPDDIRITSTTKFDTGYYAENPFGSCCVIDEFGPIQADASLKAFTELLKEYPDSKAYVFVYGGTRVFSSDSKGRERTIRTTDKKRKIDDYVRTAKKLLTTSGIDGSRITIKNSGYRDTVGGVEMWIVPEGGDIPKPTPNYFPNGQ